jgi:hypothetical protein
MASVTLLFRNSEHVLLHEWHPSHYCSETVSMSCSTNGIRHITVLKQWTCPRMSLVEQECSLFRNCNVTDAISGAGHAHCFRTVMWRMSLVEQDMFTSVTLLFRNSEHVLFHEWHPSHYCSETENMSCSTNDIRHITVPSNVTDVISGAGHFHCFRTVMWRMTLVEQVLLH